MRLTAGQSESLSVFTASVPSGPRRQKYSGIRNDSGNFVYLVSCTTVSLRPDCQAANLSLVIVTIAILSMISCPRFQKRCKGTAFFRTRKLFTKFFLPIPGGRNFRNETNQGQTRAHSEPRRAVLLWFRTGGGGFGYRSAKMKIFHKGRFFMLQSMFSPKCGLFWA